MREQSGRKECFFMPKYKATAYIRLSYTDDHSSESDSVSNQRKLIENFVERNPDIEVVSEKIDDGYSGIIFDRPAFKEMMQDVTDGNIKLPLKIFTPVSISTTPKILRDTAFPFPTWWCFIRTGRTPPTM